MTKPVMSLLSVTADQVKVSFSIAIFFLGISAAFLGHFVERYGPLASGMLSATCWGLGLVGAGIAVRMESLWMLYLSYGVLGGIGLIGVFNGIGRIVWASASDYLGRPATYIAFFVIQTIAYAALPSIQHVLLFQIVLYLIMTCYGGGFATVPAFLGDLFGTKKLGAVHGYTLTAWSVAGILGPSVLVPLVHIESATGQVTGTDYTKLLYLCSGLFVVALATSMLMVADIRSKRRAMDPA